MLVGMICLGIAVFQARVLPRWVGALFVMTPLLGAGQARLREREPQSPTLLFVSLSVVAVHTLQIGIRRNWA